MIGLSKLILGPLTLNLGRISLETLGKFVIDQTEENRPEAIER